MDWFFIAIYSGNLLNYIDRGLISSLLPIFQSEFNLSKMEQGLLSSCFMLGYSVFSIIFSVLSSKYNKRNLIIIGSILWCISCLIMSVSMHKWSLYLGRCLSGIGEACYQSIVPVFLTDIYGETRGWRRTSVFYTAINIGFSIGILLGGVITNWRIIYMLEVVIGLIFISGIYYLDDNQISESQPDQINQDQINQDQINQDQKQIQHHYPTNNNEPPLTEIDKIKCIFKNSEWWMSTLGSMFVAYSSGVLSLWIPTYYRETFGDLVSYQTLTGILAVTLLASGTIGSIIGDKLSKYLAGYDFSDRYKLFKICYLVIILSIPFSFGSIFFNQSLLLSVIFLGLCLLTFACISVPNAMINVTCVTTECRSYSTSLSILLLHMGGDMPSPIISSYIWQKTHDLREAIAYSLLSLVVSILMYFIGYRISKKKRWTLLSEALINPHTLQ